MTAQIHQAGLLHRYVVDQEVTDLLMLVLSIEDRLLLGRIFRANVSLVIAVEFIHQESEHFNYDILLCVAFRWRGFSLLRGGLDDRLLRSYGSRGHRLFQLRASFWALEVNDL